jgi:methyl acetate hydrolase
MKRIVLLAAILPVATYTLVIAQRPSSNIDALVRAAVEQKQVPMVVAMVGDSRGVVYEQTAGASRDAIFAIASMTKPVTSVAVMQLVESGRVKLDQPASTYLPELATVRVYESGKLRAPKTPLTVRQLLTHTAGFGYEFLNRELFEMVAKKELPTMMAGGDAFLKAPLLFDPGARWEYGINTDWLGKLVERVSGQSLEVYFREKIFTPLGMKDSFFNVPTDKRARVVRTFQRNQDGGFAELPPPPATTGDFLSGGGGLFSTAPDYLTFVRALMSGGRLGDKRILSAESVAMMGSNQIGGLSIRALPTMIPQLAADQAMLTGGLDKFGLGFALNSKPTSTGRGANTMAWAGIYNTFFWIDREKQLGAVLMSQMLPFLDPGPKRLLDDFDSAVYALRAKPSR